MVIVRVMTKYPAILSRNQTSEQESDGNNRAGGDHGATVASVGLSVRIGWMRVYPDEPDAGPNDVLPPFDIVSGPQNIPDHVKTPTAYFELFMNENIIRTWIVETERYATEYINSHRPLQKNSRCHDWNWNSLPYADKVTEMKAFLALTVLMGMVKKPSIEDYWDTNHDATKTSGYSAVMSLRKYEILLRFFHTSNNHDAPPRCKV